MHTFLMNVATLKNRRFIGAIRVNGIVTATTLPFSSRNVAARAGFALKSDMMRADHAEQLAVAAESHAQRIAALSDADYYIASQTDALSFDPDSVSASTGRVIKTQKDECPF